MHTHEWSYLPAALVQTNASEKGYIDNNSFRCPVYTTFQSIVTDITGESERPLQRVGTPDRLCGRSRMTTTKAYEYVHVKMMAASSTSRVVPPCFHFPAVHGTKEELEA